MTKTHTHLSAGNAEVPTDALINLVNYQEQCDEDGVMVKVSRQALAEVLVYVQLVRPDLNGAVPQQVKVTEALEEWRMARQDVFDNTTKISEENVARWKRLSDAEHSLMDVARAASSPLTRPDRGAHD